MKLNKHINVCHICGERDKLTYEHVPPKAAFNDKPCNLVSLQTMLEKDTLPWETKGLPYIQLQKGKGFYSLCQSCNNITGAWYGSSYTNFVLGIHSVLHDEPNLSDIAALQLVARQINPLSIFKQIISMFCSVNVEALGSNFKSFLLNKESQQFDKSKYKVCMYIQKGNIERYCPISVIATIDSYSMKTISEISTYPLGFILYLLNGKETTFDGLDITSFADYDYNGEHNLKMTIPMYECNTCFPTDFRLKNDILQTKLDNEALTSMES